MFSKSPLGLVTHEDVQAHNVRACVTEEAAEQAAGHNKMSITSGQQNHV